ncbi:putative Rna-binding protein Nova-1 [Cardiosporidium cionae]|uniref:Rna-binding protein Nova-1 n=1 Tax=Cardiosporidium cionae TaxID=476202 RepID=A0ABQ7JAZ3_9APIC|nr:putative Rna-binding protein Nova-1 [Cardiosporidium cionae]|eukprot:KAF8821154.1 putative Rna-binding protein Nova-1 [Cardiosporidium cionae]
MKEYANQQSFSLPLKMKTASMKLLQGPCYLRLLVSNVVAGSVIGKTGHTLEALQAQSGSSIKVFTNVVHFPGTHERIVVIAGTQEQMILALNLIIDKIEEAATNHSKVTTPPQSGRITVRLLLPRSAAAAVIGKGGQKIRQLQESSQASLQISSREDAVSERVATIIGECPTVRVAAAGVAEIIQSDCTLKNYLLLDYGNSIVPPPVAALPGGALPGHFGAGKINAYASTTPYAPPLSPFAIYGGNRTNGLQQPAASRSALHPEKLQRNCEVFIHIPDEFVGSVIGKNGSFLGEIMSISGARVRISQKGELIPGTTDRECKISGSVRNVHSAHILLLQRLEQAYVGVNSSASNGNSITQTNGKVTSGTAEQLEPQSVDAADSADMYVDGRGISTVGTLRNPYISSNVVQAVPYSAPLPLVSSAQQTKGIF